MVLPKRVAMETRLIAMETLVSLWRLRADAILLSGEIGGKTVLLTWRVEHLHDIGPALIFYDVTIETNFHQILTRAHSNYSCVQIDFTLRGKLAKVSIYCVCSKNYNKLFSFVSNILMPMECQKGLKTKLQRANKIVFELIWPVTNSKFTVIF